MSMISMTNWVEEVEYNNCLGIILDIQTSSLGKIGIDYNVSTRNITNAMIPIDDYLNAIMAYFQNNNKNMQLSHNIIGGNGIGTGNTMLPLYINKHHWNNAKNYLPYILGLALSHNPLAFTKNHINLYFNVLNDFTRCIVFDKLYQNDQTIRLYISFLRTCHQICVDNGFDKGFNKFIKNILDKPENRVMYQYDTYKKYIGQLLAINYKNKNNTNLLLEYINEEIIRKNLNKNELISRINNIKIVDSNSNELDEYDYLEKFNNMANGSNDIVNNYVFDNILAYLNISKILDELYTKYGSFAKFVDTIDTQYGYLMDDDVDHIKNKLAELNVNFDMYDYYSLLGYDKNQTNKLIAHHMLQGYTMSKNKYKIMAIKNNEYVDMHKTNIGMEDIIEKYKSIFKIT